MASAKQFAMTYCHRAFNPENKELTLENIETTFKTKVSQKKLDDINKFIKADLAKLRARYTKYAEKYCPDLLYLMEQN